MVRSLRGHFFAPGKHRLRAWTWLRASMSSQCQTILQQCSAHLQLEVVLIALKNACSGTKFVESFTVFTKLHVWCGDQKIATSVCSISFICSSSLPLLWLLQEPRQPFQKFTLMARPLQVTAFEAPSSCSLLFTTDLDTQIYTTSSNRNFARKQA